MRIQKKRIRNPEPYLYPFAPDDGLYIAAPVTAETAPLLLSYGIQQDGIERIPVPKKSATQTNADGRWRILRDLPMEPREFEHEYHIVDWHGGHHYGICWQTRMCYQRELIPPTEIAFRIEDGVVYSPRFLNTEENLNSIKVAINVLLEILGFCDLLNDQKSPAIMPAKQVEVPWEILRKGTRERVDWEKYVNEITDARPKSQRNIIKQRHEHLWKHQPDFCVLGAQNFWGYVVYGFTEQNLFVFECNRIDNATYFFQR